MTLVPAVSDLKVDLTPLGPPVEMVTLIACISPQVVPVRGGLGYPWAALSIRWRRPDVAAARVTRGQALSSWAGQSCSPRGRAGRAGVCSPVVKGRWSREKPPGTPSSPRDEELEGTRAFPSRIRVIVAGDAQIRDSYSRVTLW